MNQNKHNIEQIILKIEANQNKLSYADMSIRSEAERAIATYHADIIAAFKMLQEENEKLRRGEQDFVNWLGMKVSGNRPIASEFSTGEQLPTFFIPREG